MNEQDRISVKVNENTWIFIRDGEKAKARADLKNFLKMTKPENSLKSRNEIPAGYFDKMTKIILSCKEPAQYNSALRILTSLEKRYSITRELRGIRVILSEFHPFILNP